MTTVKQPSETPKEKLSSSSTSDGATSTKSVDKTTHYKLNSRSTKGKSEKKEPNEAKTNIIEFNLFAPYINRAAVAGDFSDWKEIPLYKDTDGTFRVGVELADGDYDYKFWVESKSPWQLDQWVSIADPQATDINEKNGDNAVLRVRDGQIIVDDYQWQHDDKALPSDAELVIYEMHVADFGGNFQGVVDKLDYLTGLGINALELMPLAEFPGERSWGYNPKFFYAVESAYGETSDLKHLIDECHARGIRVILDVVANHAQQDSPLAQIDHNYWFVENNTDAAQFGPKFDYQHFDDNLGIFPSRKFINEVAFYWVSEFHLDGIRFDATALINNFDFLGWLTEALKQTSGSKPLYLVAEHIPLDPAIVGVDGPMDGLWNDPFYFQMTANLRESEFEGWQPFDWDKTMAGIQPARTGILGPTAAVQYLSNHDHNRLMFELGAAEILNEKAFRKVKLGMAVMLTAVGVPMIWMGDEYGEPNDKSMDARPLNWELLQNEANAHLYHYVSGLIFLRKSVGALKSENIEFFYADPENKVLAWKRWDEGGSLVAVVANFGDTALGDYKIPNFPADGEWHEFTFDYDIAAENGVLVDLLDQSQCKVYVKK